MKQKQQKSNKYKPKTNKLLDSCLSAEKNIMTAFLVLCKYAAQHQQDQKHLIWAEIRENTLFFMQEIKSFGHPTAATYWD